jgi:CMP-N-acetylneuraminic acid synthetase
MTTLAVILARGGSKGIPGKNSKLLRGTPLVEWCLRAAMNANQIDTVLLSSDDQTIQNIGHSLGCEVHIRKPEDAMDTTSSEQSLIAALHEHPSAVDAEVVLMVQPTSPFTTSQDFEAALTQFAEGNYDSMVTTVNTHTFSWQIQADDTATPSYDPKNRPRRQDIKNKRQENGAFYITKRSILEQEKCRLGGRIGCYTMEDHNRTEIDDDFDWTVIETIAEKMNLKPEKIG